MKNLTIAFVFSLVLSSVGFAADSSTAYFEPAGISITEEVPTAEDIAASYLEPSQNPSDFWDGAQAMEWGTMVLIGEKVIEIVKAGAPVVDIKRTAVSVVPAGVLGWNQLSGWQAPVAKIYNVVVTNGLGMNVVDLRLKVSAMWGGNLMGRGQYLANVLVVPTNTRVLWGWNLDLWSENGEPVNTGTFEQPRAGLGFDIRYRMKTYLNELNGAQDFFVTGDGQISQL